ncbi:hypothetical protein HGRIS_003270 [Hohenbuehelia grisea]|uniref:Uncharacterized protein n=1 Tax=Hohenbuehelia grisea TaxID=104357 RepID=A0ABR3JP73_9AGAR
MLSVSSTEDIGRAVHPVALPTSQRRSSTLESSRPPAVKAHVRDLSLIEGAYHLHPADTKTGFEELINTYWSGEERKTAPLALLNNFSEKEVKALPPVLLIEGSSREPKWVQVVGKDFYEALKVRVGEDQGRVHKIWGKGHNHLSITLALGTGEGEEWAEETVKWIKGNLNAKDGKKRKLESVPSRCTLALSVRRVIM